MRPLLHFLNFLFVLLLPFFSPATTYYVAGNGNDSNAGTSTAQPFQSIARANALSLNPGDSLLFRRGDAFLGSLSINDNGTSANPIYVGGYSVGAMPTFYGGPPLNGWSLHQGAIFKRHLTETPGVLTVDGVPTMLARHPNAGWAYLDLGNPNTIALDTARIGDPDWTGAHLLIMENDWSLNPFTVANFNASTGLFTLNSGINALNTSTHIEYYVVNHLAALDSPGEWFYDSVTDTLFLWTLQSDSPDNHLVRGAAEDYGVFVNGDYVHVEGLRMRNYAHSGVRFNNRHHVEVRENDIGNVRRFGVYSLFGEENIVRGNTITNTGLYGILGFDSPDALVEDNVVEDIGTARQISELGLGTSGGSGIRLSGDRNVFRHNHVRNVGYLGLHFGGESVVVEENSLRYFCQTNWDGGAIYTWNEDFDSTGSAGTVIQRNIIVGGMNDSVPRFPDDRAAHGIYTDDRIHDVQIEDNFVAQTTRGIFLHNNQRVEARGNELYNNWQNDVRLTTDAIVSEGDMV
ncbi:MAG: right-handed parallel beta-helix repeat-containing protein, partial [Bacteroidota bacterium]